MGAFARVIAILFGSADYPEAVFPAWALIGTAVVIGALVYRRGAPLTPATVAGVGLLLAATWWGAGHPITRLPLLGALHLEHWVWILMAYALVALPYSLWQVLQAEHVNWPQLGTGLAILALDLWLITEAVVALGRMLTERRVVTRSGPQTA